MRCACFSKSRSEEHTSELQSHSDLVCRLRSTLFPYTTLFRSPRLNRRRSISRELEPARRFLSQASSEPCRARNDRAFRCWHLFAFIRSYLLRNANPVRCGVHVFRNLDHLATSSVLLLSGNLTK